MARPIKQTVDYFPHKCTHGKTIFILEERYGNDGYAFWFKLLELLGSTEGHCLRLENPVDWEFLTSKTRVNSETCEEILNLLAKLGAIDTELWSHRVVWSDNFIENVKDAYRNRTSEIPDKPSFLRKKPTSSEVSDVNNPQSRVKESILNKSNKDSRHKTPIKQIIDLYHEHCLSLPNIKVITDKRKADIRTRWQKYNDLDTYRELFTRAEASDFLSGRSGRWNGCNFDWLMKEANMVKVLEGNYDNKPQQGNVNNALRLVEKYRKEGS